MAWVGVASAQDDTSSSLHAGTVVINNPTERQLFGRLLCQCGDCARLPLDTCACGWADDKRAEVREMLSAGVEPSKIQDTYRAQYGAAALAIPSDQGTRPCALGRAGRRDGVRDRSGRRRRAPVATTWGRVTSRQRPSDLARELDYDDSRSNEELARLEEGG